MVADHPENTLSSVYTVRFTDRVFLHAFQKKAKSGIATPRSEIALIKQPLNKQSSDQAFTLARATQHG